MATLKHPTSLCHCEALAFLLAAGGFVLIRSSCCLLSTWCAGETAQFWDAVCYAEGQLLPYLCASTVRGYRFCAAQGVDINLISNEWLNNVTDSFCVLQILVLWPKTLFSNSSCMWPCLSSLSSWVVTVEGKKKKNHFCTARSRDRDKVVSFLRVLSGFRSSLHSQGPKHTWRLGFWE